MWAQLGAAAGGFIAKEIGYNRQKRDAQTATHTAYKRQRQLMQDAPSLHMKGLEKAGLNRILAAGGQPTGANVQQEATPERKTDYMQEALMQSQIDAANATAKKLTAEAEITEAQVPISKKIEEVTSGIINTTAKKAKLFGKKYEEVMKKATFYEKKRAKGKKPPKPIESRFQSLHKTW